MKDARYQPSQFRQQSLNMQYLAEHLRESYMIEGLREPALSEDMARTLTTFLTADRIGLDLLEKTVAVLQRGAILRKEEGVNVVVGAHVPPAGGPRIPKLTKALLLKFEEVFRRNPTEQGLGGNWQELMGLHVQYEKLHPFTDGNGRSGRLLWYRYTYMRGTASMSFLHQFYYYGLRKLDGKAE